MSSIISSISLAPKTNEREEEGEAEAKDAATFEKVEENETNEGEVSEKGSDELEDIFKRVRFDTLSATQSRAADCAEAESEFLVRIQKEMSVRRLIQQYDADRRLFMLGLSVLNVLTAGILSIIFYILAKYLEGFSLQPDRAELSDYNIHLVCTVFGLVIAPVYAILIYRIFPNMKYSTLTAIHVAFLMSASLLSLFGIKISYQSHHVYGVVHLYSLHGWLGVGITTLLFFSIVSGNWIYLSPTQIPFLVYCHRTSGMIMFILCCGASISGLITRSQHLIRILVGSEKQRIPDRVIILNTLGMLITVFGILARSLIGDQRFRRRPRPMETSDEDEALSTGLLRYLTATDTSIKLREVERSWAEIAVEQEPEEPIAEELPIPEYFDPVVSLPPLRILPVHRGRTQSPPELARAEL